MSDFLQYQENAEQIASQITSMLDGMESSKETDKKESSRIVQSLLNDQENVIQTIIAESNIWSPDERREARNYITQLRTKIADFQTRLAPFLDQNNDGMIIFNENISDDGMESPLIAHQGDTQNIPKNYENDDDEDGIFAGSADQSKCILITRIVLSVLIIIAIGFILYQLYK